MSFDDPDLIACAQLVEKGDPDRFLALMAAPVAARVKLFPIFAANVEIARAPWVTQEEMIAEMRLQWWRDVLDDIADGKEPRRHEVVTPLARVLTPQTAQWMAALVEARRWDIYSDPFEDEAALERYLQTTSGNLLRVAAATMAQVGEADLQDLGFAHGLANFFRALPALEQAGKIPLYDGRPDTLRGLAERGLIRLANARNHPGLSNTANPVLRTAWLSQAILRNVVKDPGRVAMGGLTPAPAWQKLSLFWKVQTGGW